MSDDLDDDPTGVQTPTAPQTFYPNVAEFVAGFLSPVYAREWDKMDDFHWCSRWWLHVEAVARLEAMWRAWETLRRDPGTGPSVWFRDHCDPAMTALTNPYGTFRRCHPNGHNVWNPLPVEPPPDAMFTTHLDSNDQDG